MFKEELKELTRSLKIALKENGGEFSAVGFVLPEPNPEEIPVSLATPVAVQLPPEQALDNLFRNVIGDCQRCPLSRTRTKIVFGVGNARSPVMFIGEGPGFDEDLQGEPFVGKAGQLLTRIIESIGLARTSVYIANIVKCHPMVDPTQPQKRGNDRPPDISEIEKCLPFLHEQIRIIRPKIIVTLGATATRALLNKNAGITKLRGSIYTLDLDHGSGPISVLPTFHPAALLRDENLKKDVWADMKKLRDFLGLTPPPRESVSA